MQQGFARLRAPDTARSFSSQISFVVTLLGNLRRKRQLRSRSVRTSPAWSRHAHMRDTPSLQHGATRPPTHVRVAHRNGHAVPIVTNTRTRQMPAAPSPRFAKKPYGFAPRDATRRWTVPPAISRCNRETGYDTKRDGCTVPIVHETMRVLTSPHRKRGIRPCACATTPRDSSQSRPAFRSAHMHPQQRYR